MDRGLFRSEFYRTYINENQNNENIEKPKREEVVNFKHGLNYSKLDNDGYINVGAKVNGSTAIIGKTSPVENTNDKSKKDATIFSRDKENGIVDNVLVTTNEQGQRISKVKIRSGRMPEMGDKLASRFAQKGTIGLTVRQEDMPFTCEGITPDIIINSHCIPSRATIGQLIESVLGKIGLFEGNITDGTIFTEFNHNNLVSRLHEAGYQNKGYEVLYNGMTGEQMNAQIFIGPTYYQRLKHLVKDKIQCRAKGPKQHLIRQPLEGRGRDGGLRFGEMERDCSCFGTCISIENNLSVRIENMSECGFNVLSFDEKKNGIVNSKQTGFLYKGERECIELTLQDGRTLTFTEEHPFLTSDNQWIKARDITLNTTVLKVGLTGPELNIENEIKECNGWSLQVGSLLLKTDSKEEYLKTLSFVRIIGILITDGHITKRDFKGSIYLGHQLDLNDILNDFKKFCCIDTTPKMKGNSYVIYIPPEFMKDIIQLKGLLVGAKISQADSLPEFVIDESCPRPIVREFLGAIMGGDGHTCLLGTHREKRDLLTSPSFSRSKTYEYVESLETTFDQIIKLFNKCGIQKITIQKAKETSASKRNNKDKDEDEKEERSYQLTLHLDIDEMIPFAENIGFRYCYHKSQRLEAAVSYRKLRNAVIRQHNWIINRVDEITNYSNIKKEKPNARIQTKKAIKQALEELEQKETLVHTYAIPSTHDFTDHLIKGTSFGKFNSNGFPTAEQYIKEIGAFDWFINDDDSKKKIAYGTDRDREVLPTLQLKVIGRRKVGLRPVFDIEVENTHNFLAEGVVAHNCSISHGASHFLREKLFLLSDKYTADVCNKCGILGLARNFKFECMHCRNKNDYSTVHIPYACKLLFQELMAMQIAPRIKPDGTIDV